MDIRSLGIVVGWFVFVTLGTILLERYVNTTWALIGCLLSIALLSWLYFEDITRWAPAHKSWFLACCALNRGDHSANVRRTAASFNEPRES